MNLDEQVFFQKENITLYGGNCLDVLKLLPAGLVNCCITSPPYWKLKDYGNEAQLGLEETFQDYLKKIVEVFTEIRRILKDDGTIWVNMGDMYASRNRGVESGFKPKDLVGMPWRLAIALQDDGWYLRSDIIWHKPDSVPETVMDRPTRGHEYIFLLSKSEKYYYDIDAIREPHTMRQQRRITPRSDHPKGERNKQPGQAPADRPEYSEKLAEEKGVAGHPLGRNKRTVWTIPIQPSYKGAHFATYPVKLVETCLLAGCPKDGTVLEPFSGSGTTLVAASMHGRKGIGIELNKEYNDLAVKRLNEHFEAEAARKSQPANVFE